MQANIPKSYDKYKFTAQKAKGLISTCCSAISEKNSKMKYAIKIISIPKAQEFYDHIYNEITHLNMLKGDKIVPRLIEQKNDSNFKYMVMEEIEGITLSEKIHKLETRQEILEILENIIKGISIMHLKGIIHINLNLDHILINNKNEIRFCGFLFSRSASTSPKCKFFPPNDVFQAPELNALNDLNKINDKADIYSFGIIALMLILGKKIKELKENPINLLEGKLIGSDLSALIKQCLSKDPQSRPTAKELCEKKEIFKSFQLSSLGKSITSLYHIPLIGIKDIPYTIIKKIKEGGFSIVYEGIKNNDESKKTYAIKKITMQKMYENQKNLRLCLSEIETLYFTNFCEYTVYIYDAFRTNEDIYLVLEFLNDGSLGDYLEDFKQMKMIPKIDLQNYEFLDLVTVKFIAWNLAKGMKMLHSYNIVHRDLKPDNILIKKNSNNEITEIKICDLGSSKKLFRITEIYTTKGGTHGYMSPEIFAKICEVKGFVDNVLTSKCDIWSYGCILFYLAYGISILDYVAPSKNCIDFKFPQKEINPLLFKLISKCLQKDPQDRPDFQNILLDPFLNFVSIPKLLPTFEKGKLLKETLNSKLYFDLTGKWIIKEFSKENISLNELLCGIDLMDKMKYCPQILRINGYFETDKIFSIIYEYFESQNLEESNLFQNANIELIKYIYNEIVKGLKYLNGRIIFHGKINPRNILVSTNRKNIKIIGLEKRKIENEIIQLTDDLIEYSRPDMLTRKEYCQEDDFWSLGLLLYYMVYGPFEIKNIVKGESIIIQENGKNESSVINSKIRYLLFEKDKKYAELFL